MICKWKKLLIKWSVASVILHETWVKIGLEQGRGDTGGRSIDWLKLRRLDNNFIQNLKLIKSTATFDKKTISVYEHSLKRLFVIYMCKETIITELKERKLKLFTLFTEMCIRISVVGVIKQKIPLQNN